MLVLTNVEVLYGGSILVLRGISLEVADGNITLLLGANGSGKSSTLKAISGLLYAELGKVTDGSIEFDGQRIDVKDPVDIVKAGVIQVIQGRLLFEHLSTEDNLLLGAYYRKESASIVKRNLDMVYGYFPRIRELRNRTSGYLSGGEQQMLVVGRALMGQPKLMLLDEPSLGLAPLLVKEIFEIVKTINKEMNMSILLVEQNAMVALTIGDYGYVMENGRIVLDGTNKQLLDNEDIREFYLGLSGIGERKGYREVKHYKRRKRWIG